MTKSCHEWGTRYPYDRLTEVWAREVSVPTHDVKLS
jgi:hypothetical protein